MSRGSSRAEMIFHSPILRAYSKNSLMCRGAVAETAALAARVNLTLELGNWVFPTLKYPRRHTQHGD